MLTLPISQIGINKEWTIICAMAKSNGFPESIIHNLRKKLTLKKQLPGRKHTKCRTPFKYWLEGLRHI
jgi:hypothetical protein